MVAQKTFNNIVSDREVSLAIEQLYISEYPPYSGTFSPTRVTVGSFGVGPAGAGLGWRHLGAVVEDSCVVSLSKEKFQLRTGIPKGLQFEAIMGMNGTFEIQLYSHEAKKVYFAMGNVYPNNLIVANSPTIVNTIPTPTITQVTLLSSPAEPWNVGDLIVNPYFVLQPGLLIFNDMVHANNYAYISSINGLTVVFSPGFDATPPSPGGGLQRVPGVVSPFGTSKIRKFSILGVADFVDGVQVVHYFPVVTPAGDWSETIKSDDVGRISLKFDARATISTSYGVNAEQILGERFWFPWQ